LPAGNFTPEIKTRAMYIVHRPTHLREWMNGPGRAGIVGFVPTMGALHAGHLSLVRRSLAETDITVVSIFVNPLQFNDPADLEKYPRPVEEDIRLLTEAGAHLLFLPEVEDIYPPGDRRSIDFDPGPLAAGMEGFFRPGHFKGMAEVVYRLLDLVRPDRLYMGQKDYQQLAIVRRMVQHYDLPVEVVMCPTQREANGLAMSSRNVRLSAEARTRAGVIHDALVAGRTAFAAGQPVADIRRMAVDLIGQAGFEVEYFDIVNGNTLMSVTDRGEAPLVVACCAVRVEGVRLIDNMVWVSPDPS